MENKKNTPPRGVLIAIAAIILMIIVYVILTGVFPGVFEKLNDGTMDTVKAIKQK